jgi:hypothetical protein
MILYSPAGKAIEVDPEQKDILLENGYTEEPTPAKPIPVKPSPKQAPKPTGTK